MKLIHLFLVILALSSCSHEKPKGKTEAEVLYKEAKNLADDGRYILATEKLNQLKNKYPYSYYATPAELMIADILYKQENFVESAAAYLLFRDFHPKYAQMDYVVFRIADSYFKQIPDTDDRDLQGAVEAIKYYKEVLNKYPNSKYSKDTKEQINKCKTKLRNKEKYIADFYFKTEVYSAARWRYLDILENFSERKLRDHSMIRVIQSSYYLKEFDACKMYYHQYTNEISEKRKSEYQDLRKLCKI